MPINVKPITLCRAETDDRPGLLADTLAPLATAGSSLRVVMGYKVAGQPGRAVLELFPVTGKKASAAASAAGLAASGIPTLLVEGDDRPGLGHALTRAIADVGVDLHFLVAQVIGRKFSAVMGFGGAEDAKKAGAAMKKAAQLAKKKR